MSFASTNISKFLRVFYLYFTFLLLLPIPTVTVFNCHNDENKYYSNAFFSFLHQLHTYIWKPCSSTLSLSIYIYICMYVERERESNFPSLQPLSQCTVESKPSLKTISNEPLSAMLTGLLKYCYSSKLIVLLIVESPIYCFVLLGEGKMDSCLFHVHSWKQITSTGSFANANFLAINHYSSLINYSSHTINLCT